MNIDKFEEDIKKCRFCFMCRHLSGVANVTFREADTPRVRSSMIWGVMLDKSKLANADFIDTIYSSDMSAACRFHCVNKWDENGIVLAARRDIVEAGFVPEEKIVFPVKLFSSILFLFSLLFLCMFVNCIIDCKSIDQSIHHQMFLWFSLL